MPSFPPRPGLGDFFRGARLPFTAFGLIFRGGKLLALSLLCTVVTAVALAGLCWGLWSWTPELVNHFFHRPGSEALHLVWYVVVALTFLILLVVGANTVPLLVLAPLQDPLSEATEVLCGGFRPPPFSFARFLHGAWVSVGHTLLRIFFLLLGQALLFPINFIPGFGSVLWTVLATAWTIRWLATEYLDAPMARHLYPFGKVRRVAARRLALSLGFGSAVYVLLWIPVLQFFFIPVAVIAGTLLFRGLRACGELPPPPGALHS